MMILSECLCDELLFNIQKFRGTIFLSFRIDVKHTQVSRSHNVFIQFQDFKV